MHQYSSCVLLFLCCLKSEEQDIELELISTATLWSALQYRSTVLSDWLSVRVGVGGWCVVDGSPLACPVPEAATQHIRLSVSSPLLSSPVFRSVLPPSCQCWSQREGVHHQPGDKQGAADIGYLDTSFLSISKYEIKKYFGIQGHKLL